MINLNLSWFSDIDNISTNNEKIFYVLDKDKKIVYSTEKEKFLSDLSEEPYVQKIFSFEKESGSHIEKIDGKKHLSLIQSLKVKVGILLNKLHMIA